MVCMFCFYVHVLLMFEQSALEEKFANLRWAPPPAVCYGQIQVN